VCDRSACTVSCGIVGESPVPPYDVEASLSPLPGRKPSPSLYTRKRVSLTSAGVNAWCLLLYEEVSLSLSHGAQGGSLVPPHTRARVSPSRVPLPSDDDEPATGAQLQALTKDQMYARLRDLGLLLDGNESALIDRLETACGRETPVVISSVYSTCLV
jgi:hypothetical protein